jgi:hypothetical protein
MEPISSRNILENLLNNNVIEVCIDGRIKLYRLDNNSIVYKQWDSKDWNVTGSLPILNNPDKGTKISIIESRTETDVRTEPIVGDLISDEGDVYTIKFITAHNILIENDDGVAQLWTHELWKLRKWNHVIAKQTY